MRLWVEKQKIQRLSPRGESRKNERNELNGLNWMAIEMEREKEGGGKEKHDRREVQTGQTDS